MIYFSTEHFYTRQRLLEEEEQGEEEERVDHVFPLLTSPLWHVHTWFSLECCFCGIADGKPAGGFIWRSKCLHHRLSLKGYPACVLKSVVMAAVKCVEMQAQNQSLSQW